VEKPPPSDVTFPVARLTSAASAVKPWASARLLICLGAYTTTTSSPEPVTHAWPIHSVVSAPRPVSAAAGRGPASGREVVAGLAEEPGVVAGDQGAGHQPGQHGPVCVEVLRGACLATREALGDRASSKARSAPGTSPVLRSARPLPMRPRGPGWRPGPGSAALSAPRRRSR